MEGLSLQSVLSSLLLNILNIVVLFVILRALVYKPIKKFMQQRHDSVHHEMDEATAEAEKARALQLEYQQKIERAKADVAAIIKEGNQKAQKSAEAIVTQAKQQAQEMRKGAKEQIEQDRRAAFSYLQTDITGLAVDLAQKLVQRELTEADNDAIIDRFFEQQQEMES